MYGCRIGEAAHTPCFLLVISREIDTDFSSILFFPFLFPFSLLVFYKWLFSPTIYYYSLLLLFTWLIHHPCCI
ncbi:hypothetical protein I7I50_10558 [Histoplasma capsulatum G186AR]|uniref:Uncharacterized protein n=1 Tax=Ajellomyces capsulatus TaxID=5037 RepID=A0A8H7Z3Y5_AJECA|nr:hypothetical protein I7I52_01797 [Histoplasma capsulatum]QSS69310.1 hypothetical protein I7I50_10558 [Histoplasma capsulatum G186AR]